MGQFDCREVLGLPRNAQAKDAKAALRSLARKYHPDAMRGMTYYRQEKMKLVNLAYEALCEDRDEVAVDDDWEETLLVLDRTHRLLEEVNSTLSLANVMTRDIDLNPLEAWKRTASGLLDKGEPQADRAELERAESFLRKLQASVEARRRLIEERRRRVHDIARSALCELQAFLRDLPPGLRCAASDALQSSTVALSSALRTGNVEEIERNLGECQKLLQDARKAVEIERSEMLRQASRALARTDLASRIALTRRIDPAERSKLDRLSGSIADAALRDDAPEVRRLSLEFDLVYEGIGRTEEWRGAIAVVRQEAEARLDAARKTLSRYAPGGGAWATIIDAVDLDLKADDVSVWRANERSVDLAVCVECLSSAIAIGDEVAEPLCRMVSECYLSADDVRRLREVRRRMADAAAKGDLEETRLWTGRLAAFARSREGDFAAYSLRWHKLRERAASLTVRAECLSAQERQDAQDELDSAFASRDERKANAALAELEMMIGREVESSALVLDAAALCALARKRMAAEECTCCWASPEERRKAAAWLAVLESCAGEGRLDLLAVGVPLFREFVRLHDEGHGEVVEASRREIAGRLRQVLSEDADDTHPLNADQMYCTRSAFGARLLLHTHDV